MPWTTLCDLDELTADTGKYVEIDGFHLAVFLHDGVPSVIDNACPHAGGPMASGFVQDGCAVCPWHYWAFNLKTGDMTNGAAKIAVYPSRVRDFQNRKLVQAELPTP